MTQGRLTSLPSATVTFGIGSANIGGSESAWHIIVIMCRILMVKYRLLLCRSAIFFPSVCLLLKFQGQFFHGSPWISRDISSMIFAPPPTALQLSMSRRCYQFRMSMKHLSHCTFATVVELQNRAENHRCFYRAAEWIAAEALVRLFCRPPPPWYFSIYAWQRVFRAEWAINANSHRPRIFFFFFFWCSMKLA